MKHFRLVFTVGLLVGVAALVGCGQSGPPRAPVTGKVTANGQAVTGGSLTFAPITTETNALSSPVVAAVKEDGSFEVTGGAVAGKHRVSYEPPSIPYEAPTWDGQGTPPQAPKSPYAGMAPKDKEVEFAASANNLNIELVPAGA